MKNRKSTDTDSNPLQDLLTGKDALDTPKPERFKVLNNHQTLNQRILKVKHF